MAFSRLKIAKKYKRTHPYTTNHVKDVEGGVLSAWYNSYDPQTKTLSMPLMVGGELTRIVNEKENWYIWDKLKTEHYDKIIGVEKIKLGPGITIIPDKAFANRVINLGTKKFCQKFTSVDMSSSNVTIIGKEAFLGNSSLTEIKMNKNVKVIGENCFTHTGVDSFEIDSPVPIVYLLQPQLNHMLALDYVSKEYIKYVNLNSVYIDFPISDNKTLKIKPQSNNIDLLNLENCDCVIYLGSEFIVENSPFMKNIIKSNVKYTYPTRLSLIDKTTNTQFNALYDMYRNKFTGDASMFYCHNLMRYVIKRNINIAYSNKYVVNLNSDCVKVAVLAYNSMTALDKKPRMGSEVTQQSLQYLTNYVNNYLTNGGGDVEYDCHWSINHDIPNKAFMGCKSLKRMHVNKHVSVGKYAFMDSGLVYFEGCFKELAPYCLFGTDIKQLKVPRDCQAVGYKAVGPDVKVTMTQKTKDEIKHIKIKEDQIDVIEPTYGRIRY